MPTCIDRELLIVEYHHAVEAFSESVKLLRDCHGDGFKRFAAQHRATELARLHVDNVRQILEVHRAEHGC